VKKTSAACMTDQSGPRRRGFVLLVVTVVVILLSLAAYSYLGEMDTENRAASMFGRDVEARMAAESGVEYVAALSCELPACTPKNTNTQSRAGKTRESKAARALARALSRMPVQRNTALSAPVASTALPHYHIIPFTRPVPRNPDDATAQNRSNTARKTAAGRNCLRHLPAAHHHTVNRRIPPGERTRLRHRHLRTQRPGPGRISPHAVRPRSPRHRLPRSHTQPRSR